MPARKEAAITVAIVEEHGAVREALTYLVERDPGFKVILACAPEEISVPAVHEGPPPALVMVGVPHGGSPGLELIAHLDLHWPEMKILMYTPSDDVAVVLRAHTNGARGILRRRCSAFVLMHALQTLHLVGAFHDEETQRILLENPDGLSPEERRRERIRAQVSDKLMLVLERICRGDDPTYEVIAGELGMKRRTVEGYAGDLFRIFGVNSKTALALAAVRVGLLRL